MMGVANRGNGEHTAPVQTLWRGSDQAESIVSLTMRCTLGALVERQMDHRRIERMTPVAMVRCPSTYRRVEAVTRVPLRSAR